MYGVQILWVNKAYIHVYIVYKVLYVFYKHLNLEDLPPFVQPPIKIFEMHRQFTMVNCDLIHFLLFFEQNQHILIFFSYFPQK